nr:energy transducer TonB [Bacteroidales bacterium]
EINITSFFNKKEEKNDDEIFVLVEDMPTFQGGGLTMFWQYVQSNIHYPEIAKENGIYGTVFVSFVVNKKGNVENIEILRSVDNSLDKEVIQTIRNAPKWEAGEQRGKKVNVSFAMNIKFVLN